MKILLIEDHAELARSLKDFLAREGCVIETATTGVEGLRLATGREHDVIVLDLGLPDVEGQTVCKSIRKAGVTTPILVLSGSAEPPTKVKLFSYGADDYVTKPFHATELHARLLALKRRGQAQAKLDNVLKVDNLVLDPDRRRVERAGQHIELRRKEFDILEYLLRNRGKVITRSMIMDNVWDVGSNTWNNTVDVHIKYLRDKVDRPFKRKLIQTAYGLGYTIDDDR